MEARKQIKIISLGEITTPDISKALAAFINLIAAKKEVALDQVKGSVQTVLHHNMALINSFKLGQVDEATFTKRMIDALCLATETDKLLTVEEFDTAWNAMNPKFKDFEAVLRQALEYHTSPNQQIILFSFTNPKDIRHLINELKTNNVDHTVNKDGQLVAVCGISVFTTYVSKQTKEELLETIIKQCHAKSAAQGTLASSMSQILSTESKQEPVEVQLVLGLNKIPDPVLSKNLDDTNRGLVETAQKLSAAVVIWSKKEESLTQVLTRPDVVPKLASVAGL